MILIVNKYLLSKKFRGISLWPFVIIRDRKDARNLVFLNHERIHQQQQLELLIIPFYIWYLTEFSIRYFQTRDANRAYRNISFEREAYANEGNLNYCIVRKRWNFTGYLNLKIKEN
ncbi:MAG: hypothetical protein R6W85_03655 [Gillisia sp.]